MLDTGQPNARRLPSSAAKNLFVQLILRDVTKVIHIVHPEQLKHGVDGLLLIHRLLDAIVV